MNVYEIVTEQVIKRLEAGVIPWRKAWASGEQFPINLVSKKRYRGLNVWMFGCLDVVVCGFCRAVLVELQASARFGRSSEARRKIFDGYLLEAVGR